MVRKFHYTSLDVLLNILNSYNKERKTLTFWASSIYAMNDPKELIYGYNFLTKAICAIEENVLNIPSKYRLSTIHNDYPIKYMSNEEINKVIYSHVFSIEDSPYIISMSNLGDSIPMWAHYGNRGNGASFAFEFDGNMEDISKLYFASPVEYGERLNIKGLIDYLVDQIQSLESIYYRSYSDEELFSHKSEALSNIINIVSPFIKNKDYSYEQEYRLAFLTKDIRYRSNGNVIIPYTPIEIPITYLKEIIIGPCANDLNVTMVNSLIRSHGIEDFIDIKRSERNYRQL